MSNNLENRQLPSYLPYLDGWRGIAIIIVLFAHFGGISKTYQFLGEFGVNVFFVLSGYLMSRILFIQKMPLNIFYRRRMARILPVFWLYIAVIFIGGWFFFQEFHRDELISVTLFLRTYFPELNISKSYLPISHIWSLNVEEHCYILLSIFSILAIRFGESSARIALTICSLLCIAFFIFYKYHPPVAQTVFGWRTEVAALPLLLSCTIFLWLTEYPIKIHSSIPIYSFLTAFCIAIFSTSVFLSYIGTSILLAVSMNTLNVAPAWTLKMLSNSILRWFGLCSYSIYLWQQIFFFSEPYAKNWNYYGIFAVISSLLIASCSYYFYERPVRKWLSVK